MRFRNPEEKRMNFLRLVPVFALVVAIFITGHSLYRYLAGADDSVTWLVIGSVAMIYFSFRTLFAVRRVFVWGDEASNRNRRADDESEEAPEDDEE